MESIQRLCWSHSQRLTPLPLSISSTGAGALIHTAASKTMRHNCPNEIRIVKRFLSSARSRSRLRVSAAGWFSGFGAKKSMLPEIVKAGDPVLYEPAQEVAKEEIGSEKIEKIIEEMISVMRQGPGVGLAAPQIGIPLKVHFLWFATFF
jgi:Polypeptide deformylase